jgi:acyl-[acyl carrier protein]--UDP-N-acetylglucosamine O-acyltransferase
MSCRECDRPDRPRRPGCGDRRRGGDRSYCVVGPDAVIGEGCRLVAHVTRHTTIGARTVVHPFASLGTPPQSVKYRGEPTLLMIGADCDIRECVTANIGTEDDRGTTEIGDHCFLMALTMAMRRTTATAEEADP